jgi:hypothetical protein
MGNMPMEAEVSRKLSGAVTPGDDIDLESHGGPNRVGQFQECKYEAA